MLEKTGWLVHKSNRAVSRYGFLPSGHTDISQEYVSVGKGKHLCHGK